MPLPRRKNEFLQEPVTLVFDHAAASADRTDKFFVVPPGKKFRLLRVDYNNVTGLAANASNFVNAKVLKGATVMANWSTETGQQGTIAADTPVAYTLTATDADRVATAGDILGLFLDCTGTVTLPAGRVVVHGVYV